MRERQIARQRMSSQLFFCILCAVYCDTVREALLKEAVTLVIDEESEDRSCQPPPLKVKKTLGSLTSMRKLSQIQPASPAQSPRDQLKKEMNKYLQFPIIDGDDDPLEW